jgi:hypothetical protein
MFGSTLWKPTLGFLILPLLVAVGEPHFRPPAGWSQESSGRDLFLDHLREHFDDIHDVSMRFHMDDPSIGGVIVFRMTWEQGRMVAGEVIENETGNNSEGEAFLSMMGNWTIDGISGPSTFDIPLRIKLVGSDDPAFPERGIVTGSVTAGSDKSIHNAVVSFEPLQGQAAVPDARSNREGIFVRTLIPAGRWRVTCAAEGFRTSSPEVIELNAGTHRILHFSLYQ